MAACGGNVPAGRALPSSGPRSQRVIRWGFMDASIAAIRRDGWGVIVVLIGAVAWGCSNVVADPRAATSGAGGTSATSSSSGATSATTAAASSGSGGGGGAGGTTSAASSSTTSSGTGSCSPCPPVVLASDVAYPNDLALDDHYVYVSVWGGGSAGPDTTSGSLQRVPKAGGPAEVLASGLDHPGWIGVDGSTLFATIGSTVVSVPKGGGALTQLATFTDKPTALALDDDAVYVALYLQASVVRIPKAGGAPAVVATANGSPLSLLVDAMNLYWTDGTGLYAMPKAGGTPVALTTQYAGRLAADADTLYTYHPPSPTGDVWRIAKLGGALDALATESHPGLWPVATDGLNVYWSNNADGELRMVPRQGGSVTTIATGQGEVDRMAADGSGLYWIGHYAFNVVKLSP